MPHDSSIPRAALLGAGALIALTFVAATAARIGGVGTVEVPTATAVASQELRFENRPDGSVAVFHVPEEQPAAVLASGRNGFVQGVMRSLARERMLHDVGSEQPFRLIRWSDGRLSLVDLATDRSVELNAFGSDNLKVFAALMDGGHAAR